MGGIACRTATAMRAALALAALAAALTCCSANVRVEGEQRRHLLERTAQREGQRMQELYAEPPLVTDKTIHEAEQMHIGAPIYGVHPAAAAHPAAAYARKPAQMQVHHGMMLEGEMPSAFANIPWWVHILTFLGAVGTISLMFYLTERMWDKRQQSG